MSQFVTQVWPVFCFTKKIWFPEQIAIQAYLDERARRTSRKVVYCCIIGGYDTLAQPYHIDPDWDYICYTDNAGLIAKGQDGVWQVSPVR